MPDNWRKLQNPSIDCNKKLQMSSIMEKNLKSIAKFVNHENFFFNSSFSRNGEESYKKNLQNLSIGCRIHHEIPLINGDSETNQFKISLLNRMQECFLRNVLFKKNSRQVDISFSYQHCMKTHGKMQSLQTNVIYNLLNVCIQ